MDSSVLIQSPIEARSPNFNHFLHPNYDTMLKESIDRFLGSVHSEAPDLSAFRSIFSRLLQSSADPPLEIIWFYSAVNYHDSVLSSSKKDLLDRVAAVKNLLQLFAGCSSSCGGVKSIALLAPAVSDLFSCLLEAEKSSGKAAKKVKREIEGLVEGILSYISICSGKDCENKELGTGLLPCFLDLVRVWTVGRADGQSGLRELFPLVSEETRARFTEEGCGVGYLAGVVIVEAFLLRLCLKVRASGASRTDLRKECMIWAVSSITVFRNRVFFGILLTLLLDSELPIVSLLDSKDENLVKDILYDVVILVEYSFLYPGMEMEQSYDVTRSLAIRRLIVTHDAIRIARVKGDHGKAISYMNAFSASRLPSEIIKWVTNQIGTEKVKRPSANTPQVLLRWLVDLEDQGLILFKDSLLKLSNKLIFEDDEESKEASGISMLNLKSKQTEDLFFFDNKGEVAESAEDEEMQSTDAAFLAAAQTMKSPTSNGRRKRKETRAEVETQIKFVKYKVHSSGVKDLFSPSVADGMGSGSEVDNPLSDDEMEEMEC